MLVEEGTQRGGKEQSYGSEWSIKNKQTNKGQRMLVMLERMEAKIKNLYYYIYSRILYTATLRGRNEKENLCTLQTQWCYVGDENHINTQIDTSIHLIFCKEKNNSKIFPTMRYCTRRNNSPREITESFSQLTGKFTLLHRMLDNVF